MLWCFYFWRFWLITNIVIFHLKIYLFYLLLFSSFHVSKKKIVFFSHVMTIIIGWSKRSFTFFQLSSLHTFIHGSHKVETFLEPEFVCLGHWSRKKKIDMQLRLKRCRILWSSIHDWNYIHVKSQKLRTWSQPMDVFHEFWNLQLSRVSHFRTRLHSYSHVITIILRPMFCPIRSKAKI